MSDDADISHEKRWVRRPSWEWTNRDFRMPVLAFMRVVGTYGWVLKWEVEERFASSGINVRVPTKNAPANFKQRPGTPIIILRLTRKKDLEVLEVSIPFPKGNATPALEVIGLLEQGRLSLVVGNR